MPARAAHSSGVPEPDSAWLPLLRFWIATASSEARMRRPPPGRAWSVPCTWRQNRSALFISTLPAGRPISRRSITNPRRFRGVDFPSNGDRVLCVSRPKRVPVGRQRDVLDAVEALNRQEANVIADPEIAARIAQYEMAFRMQSSVPELMDLSGESKETLDLYGARPGDGSFASNCLLARRLAERGVRFIQLYHRDWDHHGTLKRN